MKKLKFILSVDKEEQWINTIEEEGYRLTSINPIIPLYTFERISINEPYVPYVRLDFREKWMSKEAYDEYTGLFSDSGWKLIKGSRYGGMQYFQQNRLDVTREIFSDKDSKNNMRKKYSNYSLSYGLLFILYTYISFNNGIGFSKIFNVKSWYLTPNIWELKGGRFLFSFIFETPFVIFRVLLPFIILGIGIYYLMKSIANKEK